MRIVIDGRTALMGILIIITIGLIVGFLVIPTINPRITIDEIEESQMVYTGRTEVAEGTEHWYLVFKKEVADWGKLLGQLAPILTLLSAFIIKNERRK